MVAKKNEKIPYKEFQALKERASKRKFKFSFYPWPVMTALLVPLMIFIIAAIYYAIRIKEATE